MAADSAPKGILRKGDDQPKKSGQKACIQAPLDSSDHSSSVKLVETATGIVKKDASGNIIEDRREKPRGERQALKPKVKPAADQLPAGGDVLNPADLIQHGDDIHLDDIIVPPDADTIAVRPPDVVRAPAAAVAEPPAAPAQHAGEASHHDKSAAEKEKCTIC